MKIRLLSIHYIQNINASSFPSMMKKHVPWFQIQSFFGKIQKRQSFPHHPPPPKKKGRLYFGTPFHPQKKPMVKGWWLRGGKSIPPSSALDQKSSRLEPWSSSYRPHGLNEKRPPSQDDDIRGVFCKKANRKKGAISKRDSFTIAVWGGLSWWS